MLPGWIDFFAHPHVANAFIRAGFAVYALEPRRSGRSLSDPAFRDYVTDMHDYTEELDASVALISSLHPSVSLYAHSTGGLIGGLWASEHPGAFNAVALNSPWISWWGGPHVASLFRGPVGALGRMAPEQILWTYRPEYDTTARPIPPARPLLADEVAPMEHAHARAGWVRAVLKGQSDLRKGSIDCPIWVACSDRSAFSARHRCTDPRISDMVLDVDAIAHAAPGLGRDVTVWRVRKGVHDLSLSKRKITADFLGRLTDWMAYHAAAESRQRDRRRAPHRMMSGVRA